MSYRIKTVAALTGVPRNTLLAWERRYGLVVPHRGENGYRVYSDADVALLQEVKALVDGGHAVSEAVDLVRDSADPAGVDGGSSPSAQTITPGSIEGVRRDVLSALLRYDRGVADRAVMALVGVSFRDLLHGLFLPMLVEVGDAWKAGAVSVVQEHFVSAFARDHMVSMFLRLGCGPEDGPRAVCACFPDEDHELGLLGLSIQLALAGWRVTHLGARVPEDQLFAFVREHPPRMLCVSTMVETDPDVVAAYAWRARSAVPASVLVAIGGPGARSGNVEAPLGVIFAQRVEDLVDRREA